MPLLLALGLANVVTNQYLNKKTIDEGNLQPQTWGQDTRNVGIMGGLVLATLGAMFGAPILVAGGLGVASGAYNNKDATVRVAEGLKGWIKQEADRAIARGGAAAPPPQIPMDPGYAPPPGPPVQTPGPVQQGANAFLQAILQPPPGGAVPTGPNG